MLLFLMSISLIVVIWAIVIFNRLIRARNLVRTAFSDIDVQLSRRHDLVPNLVAAVRAYARHESLTLEAVTELRSRAVESKTFEKQAANENSLGDALQHLLLIVENYPDLKASSNFIKLHKDLIQIEDHLQYARRFYNGAVRQFNDLIQQFPDLIIAKMLGFIEADFFRDDRTHAHLAPEVRLES